MTFHVDAPACRECGSIMLTTGRCPNCGVAKTAPHQPGFYWVRDRKGCWTVAEIDPHGRVFFVGTDVFDDSPSETDRWGPRIEPPA